MKDKIYYYDHNDNLKLTLNEYPYFSEPSEFKNWSWGYNNQFGKMNTFYRNKEEWPLIIGIAGDSIEDHDKLCDIFSYDVMNERPGKLMLRDWSLRCYILQAEYGYGTYTREMDRQAQFVVRAIDSTWTREKTQVFHGTGPGGGGSTDDLWRDYVMEGGTPGRGYNYGYNWVITHEGIIELAGYGNGYKIVIHGPAENPVIYLNNQPVRVYVTLAQDDKLEIVSNGNTKTIEIIKPSGYRENAFIYRDKEYTPFLELGPETALTFGGINFDFTSIERRSEPTWT